MNRYPGCTFPPNCPADEERKGFIALRVTGMESICWEQLFRLFFFLFCYSVRIKCGVTFRVPAVASFSLPSAHTLVSLISN